MSDASISSDCSEVVILDASAITVISHFDNDNDKDALNDDNANHRNRHHHHNMTPNKGERDTNNPPIAAVAAGRIIPRNINDYINPPQNNTNTNLNTNTNTTTLNNNHNDNNDNDNEELPSLANLVAATIRDRIVLEQMEEIRLLKAQLSSSQRVEITGPNGTPVYARGTFSNGDFNAVSLQSIDNDDESMMMNDHDTTGLFWDVGLEMVEQQLTNDSDTSSTSNAAAPSTNGENSVVPLNKLSNLEIRIGGVLYVTTAEVEGTSMAFGIRPGNKFDLHAGQRDMTRSAVAEFNTEDDTAATGSRSALMTFHIRDFPRGHWRSLQSVAMLNRSIALRQQEREEQREERRELRREERSERIERGELDPMMEEGEDLEEFESDYESDYDEEEDQDPLDVYNYLTLCLSKRHPKQMSDITSVSFCVKSVRGRIESLSRGGDFEQTKTKVFRRIDDIYQEELDGMDTLEEAGATLYDD